MTKVLVLYYSSYGHIEAMAYAAAEGARAGGYWRRVAVQGRGQLDGVGPAEPLAQSVRERLSGFGNIDVRKAR